jgi:hypothetical protein
LTYPRYVLHVLLKTVTKTPPSHVSCTCGGLLRSLLSALV